MAGIVGLASLLTPFASERAIDGMGVLLYSLDQWWFGFNTWYSHPITNTSFWTGNPLYLIPEIITFIGIVLSNCIVLIIAARLPNKENPTSKGLIGGAIGLLVSSIALIVSFHIVSLIGLGYSYWREMSPGFALIWQFIGSILVFFGYYVGKARSKAISF